MSRTLLTDFQLDGVFLVAATMCLVGLVVGLYFVLREDRRRPSILEREGRTTRARLRSVVEHRLNKLEVLPLQELLALPATQREAKRTHSGQKFHLETSRAERSDGGIQFTVQATQRGWLGFEVRVSGDLVVPHAKASHPLPQKPDRPLRAT